MTCMSCGTNRKPSLVAPIWIPNGSMYEISTYFCPTNCRQVALACFSSKVFHTCLNLRYVLFAQDHCSCFVSKSWSRVGDITNYFCRLTSNKYPCFVVHVKTGSIPISPGEFPVCFRFFLIHSKQMLEQLSDMNRYHVEASYTMYTPNHASHR